MRHDNDKVVIVMCEIAKQLDDLLAVGYIQITGWFIREDNFCARCQRPGDRDALLFAAGDHVWETLINGFREVHTGNLLPGDYRGFVWRLADQFQRKANIFEAGHKRK